MLLPRVLGLLVMLPLLASWGVCADPPLAIDLWRSTVPEDDASENRSQFCLGLYPGIAGVLGAPNLVSYQSSAYLSLGNGRTFSVFLGYGEEHGSSADARIYTLGFGGVRRLVVASSQRGFHGKFIRYRRWDHRDHGLHHGLSVGTESGVGFLSFTWEVGVARSERDHWMATAQVALKIAIPIFIPLGGSRGG